MKIGIAGAGLLGRLLAWRLAKQGHSVTLFEQSDKSGRSSAGWIAAGMLSVEAEIETVSVALFGMMQSAHSQWKKWIKELPLPVTLRSEGSLLVAHRRDVPELERFTQLLERYSTAGALFKTCDRSTLISLEPELNHSLVQGIWLPHEGAIDTQQLYVALEKALQDLQVIWHSHSKVSMVQPYSIVLEKEQHTFDWAIDCRGMGARDVFPELRGVRGELVYLHASEVHITHPLRLLHPRYPVYIVPRDNNYYVVGASEIEGDDESAVSVRTVLELLSAAYSVHSGFAEARVVQTQVGIRPALLDHMPAFRYQSGLLRINGLYRHGYTLAPYCIEAAMQLILGGIQAVLHPERFIQE